MIVGSVCVEFLYTEAENRLLNMLYALQAPQLLLGYAAFA